MWLSLSLWLPALAGLAQAVSETGHLFIYEQSPHQAQPARTITPETARLIIASQLGVDQDQVLRTGALEAINAYGGKQDIFASSSNERRVALLLSPGQEGYDSLKDLESARSYDVTMSPVPSIDAFSDMMTVMATEAGLSFQIASAVHWESPVTVNGRRFQIIASEDQQTLKDAVTTLAEDDYTVLVLAVPNITSSTHTKRQNKEALLADTTFASAPELFASYVPSANSTNSSRPLKGILPQCFSTLGACQAITRNCTGHGSCGLKFTDRDASSSGAPCYSCSCTSEVRINEDGTKKTTNWGGPACQKKDVVAPFWLIAGFTVFLVSLTSWGIGMLYTMGAAELPSVIGAGVSGPTRK